MANREDIDRARNLRRDASPPARKLWQFLKALRQEGHHFRRQAPFRGYVLDFVSCPDRLVIEINGAQHADAAQLEHDAVRDLVLEREGFRTVRFLAADVFGNFEGVTISVCEFLGR